MLVKLTPGGNWVTCGPAQFAVVGARLSMRSRSANMALPALLEYDVNACGFNRATVITDTDGNSTGFLICNEYGTVHVRYGVPSGTAYPKLAPRQEPRCVRLAVDGSACHPDQGIPVTVVVQSDTVLIRLYPGRWAHSYEQRIKLRSLGWAWTVPVDAAGNGLPLRIRRPLPACVFGIPAIDVEWL